MSESGLRASRAARRQPRPPTCMPPFAVVQNQTVPFAVNVSQLDNIPTAVAVPSIPERTTNTVEHTDVGRSNASVPPPRMPKRPSGTPKLKPHSKSRGIRRRKIRRGKGADTSTLLTLARTGDFLRFKEVVSKIDNESDIRIKNDKGRNVLHLSAGAGHTGVLKYCLENLNINIDSVDNYGATALHYSVRMDQIQTTKLLVTSGASLLAMDLKGKTPLHTGAAKCHIECIKLLCSSMANKKSGIPLRKRICALDKDGATPMHWAAVKGHPIAVELLLDRFEKAPAVESKNNTGQNDLLRMIDKAGRTALILAAGKGYVDVAKILLSRKKGVFALVSTADAEGATPLHWAATKGRIDMVTFLLEHGADIRAVDITGRQAQHWAADKGEMEIVKILLFAGAKRVGDNTALVAINENKTRVANELDLHRLEMLKKEENDVMNNDKNSKQMLRVNYKESQKKAIQRLLMTPNKSGRCVLHLACLSGHSKLTKWLLANGAEAALSDAYGWNCLHLSAWKGHDDCSSQILSAGIDPNVTNHSGRSAAHLAADMGHVDVLKQLAEAGADISREDEDGGSPLHWASKKGHADVINFLLGNGHESIVDIEATDECGRTAMHLAAGGGHVGAVSALIKNGGDPCTRDEEFRTPCHRAAEHGFHNVVRILIDAQDSNIDAQDSHGRTPLYIAACFGRPRIAKMLIDAGANLTLRDKHNRTPLHASAHYSKVGGNHVSTAQILISAGVNINGKDKRDWNIAHYAAWAGSTGIINLLLEKSFAKNKSHTKHQSRGKEYKLSGLLLGLTKYGRTPLHLAASKGRANVIRLLTSECRNRTLESVDDFGWTPLHLAAANNHEPAVKCLYAAGVDFMKKDKQGLTPLQLAIQKNANQHLINVMRAFGESTSTTEHKSSDMNYGGGKAETTRNTLNAHCIDPDEFADDTDDGEYPLAFRREKP